MSLRTCLPLAAALMAIGGVASAQSPSAITITVDENGNSTFTAPGFSAPLGFFQVTDPGPGGLNNALTYDLHNPPGLIAGDVVLLDSPNGPVSDIVRFNPNETLPNGDTGALVFYSNPLDGLDSLADSLTGPSAGYPNFIVLPEVPIGGGNVGAIYTPTAGQPGFVAGVGPVVTYNIISDSSTVPEPGAYALLGSLGLSGAALLRRRRAC